MNSDFDPQAFGALCADVARLEADVKSIEAKVDKLVALAERSKGAIWLGGSLLGLGGGGVAFALTHIKDWFK